MVNGVLDSGIGRLDATTDDAIPGHDILEFGFIPSRAYQALIEKRQILLEPFQRVAFRVDRDHHRHHLLSL